MFSPWRKYDMSPKSKRFLRPAPIFRAGDPRHIFVFRNLWSVENCHWTLPTDMPRLDHRAIARRLGHWLPAHGFIVILDLFEVGQRCHIAIGW